MAGFVSYATGNVAATPAASVTVPAPATIAAGNQLVAVVALTIGFQASDLAPTATGWTVVAHSYSGGKMTSILTRTAGASEPASYTFNFAVTATSGGNSIQATVWNYGQPQGGCVVADIVSGSTLHPSGSAPVWPSENLAVNAYYVVGLCYPSGLGTVSGMTQRSGSGTYDLPAWDELRSAGATGTRTEPAGGSPTYAMGFRFAVGASTAPAAPTLVSPIGGVKVDATAAIVLSSVYNSTDAQSLNGYALRIKLSGGSYQYWNATTNTLVGAIVWNSAAALAPGGTLNLTLPAAVLANGNTYNWSVAHQESGANLQGAFAADATFSTQVAPTMTLTAPTGSITTTTAPVAAWTYTTAGGAVETDWELIWETGAYGTTPGSGSQVWRATLSGGENAQPVLVNSTTYRLFGRITQTGSQKSAWVFTTFTINVTPPNAPTLVATADTDPVTHCPRAKLVATGHDTPPPFDFTHVVTEFQYSADGGTTWADVRGASAVQDVSVETATAYDYEGRFGGTPMLYRAREIGTVGTDTIAGAWSASMPVTLYSETWWVMDPLDSSSALSAQLSIDPGDVESITEDVLVILGSADPIISSDVRQQATGTYGWLVANAAARAAFEALLNRGRVLFMRTPNERADPGQCRYFRPTGPRTIAKLGPTLSPARQISTTYQTRNRP